MGFGSSVIARLLQTSIRKNLYYTIKDKVVEERMNGPVMHKFTKKMKIYGSDSTKDERENLMEILRDRVDYHKDKIISQRIYEELCGLEVKKNGKIEHSSNTHDDQVFSWLWALHIYYNGGDLMNNWGITKHVLKTDADLEEAVMDISEDATVITQDLDIVDDPVIQEQLTAMAKAPGQKMYEQWMQEEKRKDDECMDKLMQDKAVQRSLAERYHVVVPQVNQTVQTIPMSVFTDFYQDEQPIYSVRTGNLSQYW